MSEPYTYPSGFRVGDLVDLIPGPRKYNTHIFLSVGDKAVVVDPPNADFPEDAVQVRMVYEHSMAQAGLPSAGGGEGALDACILKKRVFQGQTVLR